MSFRYGSVCSGVEAASLAWNPLGWECAFVSEVEPFPCAVLHHRFGAGRPIHPLDPAEIVISDDEWKIIDGCKKENPETWRKIIESNLLGRYDEYTKRVCWIKQNNKLPETGTIPNEGDFTKIGDKYRGKIDLLVGGTPCFPSGAMVLTPSGYAPIETIKVGDTIVSANGNQCKVSATGNKSAETGAVKIVGRPAIRCTKDHPFLTCCVKRDNKRTTSTYAQLVATGGYCYTGIKESVGRYAGRLAAKPIPYTWPVCETAELQDIIELAGWYVGDGYIRRWKGENKKAIVFALVSEHKIKQFTSRFRNCFKFFAGKDGKITLCNTRIADWLSHNFGELSHAKHLPYWLYKSDFADDFMIGYIATDGHMAKRGATVISTTSSSLAYGLADLAGNASVCFHKVNPLKVIDGRQIHQRDYYTVSIYKGVTPKTKMFLGRWASRIMNWSEPKVETVYNIEVEDEHTYVVNGIAVHNCQSFSVAGKRAGLAGVSGLALDFIRLAYESQVKWIVWENVPGCFSTSGGRDFGAFLSGLSGIEIATPADGWRTAGFVRNHRRDRFGLAWRVLDAQFTRVPGFPFAIPQRRRRVFVVGYFGDWERAAAVLLEPDRLSWDTPPSRKTRKELAGDAGKSIENASGNLHGSGKDKNQSPDGRMGFRGSQFGKLVGDGTAGTLKASNAGTAAGASATIVASESGPGYWLESEVSGCLRAEGENRPSRPSNIICIAHGQSNAERLEDCGVNLTCNHEAPIVAGFMGGQGAKAGGIAYSEGVSPTVKAGQSGTNTISDVVCMNPADSQTSRIYDPKAAYPSLNANSGGGMSREGIICVHGTQDPISNSEVANAVNRNHGVENCICKHGNVAGTLEARHDSSPCADRGMNVIAFDGYNNQETGSVSKTIQTGQDYHKTPIVCYENHPSDSRNHRAENCVCVQQNQVGEVRLGDVCGSLNTNSSASGRNAAIVYENHPQDSRVKPCGECCPQLNATAGMGGGNLPLVQAIAIAENTIGRKVENGGNGLGAQEELAYTQNATGVMGVSINATVRRLLPIETERLMGFPDNHTRIPWGGKPEEDCPDSPRYKACGNSMCTNVMEWIGRRIDENEGDAP